MKASEFYEKYWKINDGKGNLIPPPPLSEKEKDFLDQSAEWGAHQAMFYRTRRRSVTVNVDYLKEDLDKQFPQYFIPINQPKLDKYGGIIEEPKPITRY